MLSRRLLKPSSLFPLNTTTTKSRFSTTRLLRDQPTYQPPTPPSSSSDASNPHRDFYKSFGRPVAKVFLGALFTYQVLYYSWSRLEATETQADKEAEVALLERELKGLEGKRKEVVQKVEEGVADGVQKGRSWLGGWLGGK